MNFYDFHIGDYASRTAHLEPMEDLAYRRMLDLYYTREAALPFETADIARLIRLRGQEEAIEAVLHEFFDNMEEGWVHSKCQEVIAAAVSKRTKAKASADQRWASERSANALPTHSERSTDAMQSHCEGNAPSPSPSPSPTTQKKKGAAAPPPDGVSDSVWADFLKTRKTKVTETALAGIRREAEKAGYGLEAALRECCARGWQGFKAEWVQGKASPGVTVPGTKARDPALKKLDEDALLTKPPPPHIAAQIASALKGKVH